MLSWSNIKYKLTLGTGGLAIVAMLKEIWHDVPLWTCLSIAMPPVLVFVFIHPDQFEQRFVRITHVAAAVWYTMVAFGIFVSLAALRPPPQDWPMALPLLAIGGVP